MVSDIFINLYSKDACKTSSKMDLMLFNKELSDFLFMHRALLANISTIYIFFIVLKKTISSFRKSFWKMHSIIRIPSIFKLSFFAPQADRVVLLFGYVLIKSPTFRFPAPSESVDKWQKFGFFRILSQLHIRSTFNGKLVTLVL